MATALNGTTGVGEGVAEELAPAPDDKSVAFEARVELVSAVAGVVNGVAVGISWRIAGVLPGVAKVIEEAAGEELAIVVAGVAVDIEAGVGEAVTTPFIAGLD